VPRNNRSVDKSLKRTALLDAAEVAFVESGFDAVSVAEVARRCGVTATTVYWYFPSKDDLLAGVVGRWLDATVEEVSGAVAGRGVEAAARAVAAVLRELSPLLATLHERAERSPAVAEVHESAHERLALVLAGEGADGTAATVFVVLVEGVLDHPFGEGLQDHLLEATIRALTGGGLLAVPVATG
jgi:AcrR family transcriptional regulator